MKLKGKIIDFLGDSNTYGAGVENPKNCYHSLLKKKYKLKAVYTHAISGSRFAHQIVPSEVPRYDLCFCGRAYDLYDKADVIVVYGGVNDYIHGDAPIGNFGDETPATFYGAVYFLMNLLQTRYTAKVVFITPARVCYKGEVEGRPSTRPMKKPDALPLKGYCDIIKQTAEKFSIPVLDLYDGLGIDPNIPEDKEKYTTDGLHLNDVGHHILAEKLGALLESL